MRIAQLQTKVYSDKSDTMKNLREQLSKLEGKHVDMVASGERDANVIKQAMREMIESEPMAEIDYVEIVDNNTMESIDTVKGDILCAIAVKINNKVRLIDNFMMEIQ